LLGADDFDLDLIGKDCFVIYQGHHGDKAAAIADVILPEAAYTEQDGIFANMEGRLQYARRAVNTLGLAKESCDIIINIARELNIGLPVTDLSSVRKLMAEENTVFAKIDSIIPNKFIQFKSREKLLKKPIAKIKMNYYMTDPISRASVTMAQCTKERERQDASDNLKSEVA